MSRSTWVERYRWDAKLIEIGEGASRSSARDPPKLLDLRTSGRTLFERLPVQGSIRMESTIASSSARRCADVPG